MPKAAEDFSDAVYDFIQKLSEEKRRFPVCREPSRALLKYKCMTFKKKYTVVFIETELEITVCEFTSSKLFKW